MGSTVQYGNEIGAGARSYEPASVMPGQTVRCIRDLMQFYKITGDRKYLTGIPAAIEWLENSYLPEDHKADKRYTHATFYELGANKPLYVHREGTSIENGRYWIDYEPRNFPGHYGMQTVVNVESLKKEYERINALSPEEAVAEYESEKNLPPSTLKVDPETAENIIKSIDERGAWVQEIRIPVYKDVVNNPPVKKMGIRTGTYIRNMRIMINYLKQ